MPNKKLGSVVDTRQPTTGLDFEKASDFEKLKWAIAELEKLEKVNIKTCDIRKPINVRLQNRLVKLIGTKPLFKCLLSGIEAKVLWDTGSQVSVIDSDWLSTYAPETELRPISDFLESDEKVEFLAANNTVVPMEGAVILEFKMGHRTFPVPFVVTSAKLGNPIIGFNVMTHAICSGDTEMVISSLREALDGVVGI